MDIFKKLKSLDLFSGIGGISLALSEYCKTVAYCEIDPYCQGVLLSRMASGHIDNAPIWDDVKTLNGKELEAIGIIVGGFPCQDISIAGNGKGLDGERSGLFFEIVRVAKEIKPKFLFLENVPAITTRGGLQVVREITALGYDCRWCVISAASVGALHRRERWFLLANSIDDGTSTNKRGGSLRERALSRKEPKESKESLRETERTSGISSDVANTESKGLEGFGRESRRSATEITQSTMCCEDNGNADGKSGLQTDSSAMSINGIRKTRGDPPTKYWPFESRDDWQEIVSTVCRVDDGVPHGVDRLRALGNAVVPCQVREAFEILIGLKCIHQQLLKPLPTE